MRYLRADDIVNQIRGYASKASVTHGESIGFHITVNAGSSYRIEIFRIGHYADKGAARYLSVDLNNGIKQITDDHKTGNGYKVNVDGSTGMIRCTWDESYSLTIPSDWLSGIYLARLTKGTSEIVDGQLSKYQSAIVFCVRSATPTAPFLCIQPTLTYQAYNGYPRVPPGKTGWREGCQASGYLQIGRSLYTDGDSVDRKGSDLSTASCPLASTGAFSSTRVSYNRPYSMDADSMCVLGSGISYDTLGYEPYFIYWAEQLGLQIDYATDLDVDAMGIDLLEHYKLVVMPGHFEYMTKNIGDALEGARSQNVRLAFLGANPAYWQVRLEQDALRGGNPIDVVAFKRALGLAPFYTTAFHSGNYCSRPMGGDGNPYFYREDFTLTGVAHKTYLALAPGNVGAMSVVNASHWIWSSNGLSVAEGSVLPGLAGYEFDTIDTTGSALPVSMPARSGSHQVLAVSTVPTAANATHYATYKGGGVFSARTMLWAWGLYKPGVNSGIAAPKFNTYSAVESALALALGNTIVQKATQNLFDEAFADTKSRARKASLSKRARNGIVRVRESNGASWGTWTTLAGFTNHPTSHVFHSNDDADVFATGTIGNPPQESLWVNSRVGSSWSNWLRLANDGDIVGPPSAVLSHSGSVTVGARGPPTQYFMKTRTDSGWSSWIFLGGEFISPPTLAASGDLTDVFGIGLNNQVWMRSYLYGQPKNGRFPLSTIGNFIDLPVAIAKDGHGTRLLAAVRAGGSIWASVQDPYTGAWTAWESSGLSTSTTPSVISPKMGMLCIVATDIGNRSIRTRAWINGAWQSAFVDHSGEVGAGDVPVVTTRNGKIYVHCIGADNSVDGIHWMLQIDADRIDQPGQWSQTG